jgi:hypothetical protein
MHDCVSCTLFNSRDCIYFGVTEALDGSLGIVVCSLVMERFLKSPEI